MDNADKSEEKLRAVILETNDGENPQTNICSYLENLQDRLKLTVKQHSQIINSSVSLIKELGEVSTMLTLSQAGSDLQITKIKRLIMEFENMHSGDSGQALSCNEVRNLQGIIADYRRLDESHLLQDSLMCCKLANESLNKVQTLMNQLTANGWKTNEASPQGSQILGASPSANCSLREKIRAFNQASEQGKNPLQNFAMCFSSKSNTDIIPSRSHTNSGYEGDVDSEVDKSLQS
ncbi:uncharacterized protein LOC132787530 isoform X1 [Drosophila nasuta]|uniref:uncharacterized protein LOC132787530 isoform X1 n=1 Tax=Drosophila nasuta TaxID=42062 RepID=UPI00295EE27E|nr:uncharacterized protein LOC132787530 isoform X1 [Drosophila nasuta]